ISHIIRESGWHQVLVFTRTKHGANRLAEKLAKDGLSAAAIHGNKSQAARTRALAGFKSGDVAVLVATDIAARGLDIDQLPQVVNFELPNVPEDYVHRIGRTGRAGATGAAVSLVDNSEIKLLKGIERLIGKTIERRSVQGWTPPAGSSASAYERQERDEDNRQPRRQGSPRGNGDRAGRPGQAPRQGAGRAGSQGRPAGQRQAAAGRSDRPAVAHRGDSGTPWPAPRKPAAGGRAPGAPRAALLGK